MYRGGSFSMVINDCTMWFVEWSCSMRRDNRLIVTFPCTLFMLPWIFRIRCTCRILGHAYPIRELVSLEYLKHVHLHRLCLYCLMQTIWNTHSCLQNLSQCHFHARNQMVNKDLSRQILLRLKLLQLVWKGPLAHSN